MIKDIIRAQKEEEKFGLNANEIVSYNALGNQEAVKEVIGIKD